MVSNVKVDKSIGLQCWGYGKIWLAMLRLTNVLVCNVDANAKQMVSNANVDKSIGLQCWC